MPDACGGGTHTRKHARMHGGGSGGRRRAPRALTVVGHPHIIAPALGRMGSCPHARACRNTMHTGYACPQACVSLATRTTTATVHARSYEALNDMLAACL
eukprot:352193-Chlamydomonas_euryale.AAC.24